MASYNTNEFRGGLKVMIDGDPCSIIENEFVKPGKGQAFNRVKLRNLKTGRVLEKTFKSGESIEAADVVHLLSDQRGNLLFRQADAQPRSQTRENLDGGLARRFDARLLGW